MNKIKIILILFVLNLIIVVLIKTNKEPFETTPQPTPQPTPQSKIMLEPPINIFSSKNKTKLVEKRCFNKDPRCHGFSLGKVFDKAANDGGVEYIIKTTPDKNFYLVNNKTNCCLTHYIKNKLNLMKFNDFDPESNGGSPKKTKPQGKPYVKYGKYSPIDKNVSLIYPLGRNNDAACNNIHLYRMFGGVFWDLSPGGVDRLNKLPLRDRPYTDCWNFLVNSDNKEYPVNKEWINPDTKKNTEFCENTFNIQNILNKLPEYKKSCHLHKDSPTCTQAKERITELLTLDIKYRNVCCFTCSMKDEVLKIHNKIVNLKSLDDDPYIITKRCFGNLLSGDKKPRNVTKTIARLTNRITDMELKCADPCKLSNGECTRASASASLATWWTCKKIDNKLKSLRAAMPTGSTSPTDGKTIYSSMGYQKGLTVLKLGTDTEKERYVVDNNSKGIEKNIYLKYEDDTTCNDYSTFLALPFTDATNPNSLLKQPLIFERVSGGLGAYVPYSAIIFEDDDTTFVEANVINPKFKHVLDFVNPNTTIPTPSVTDNTYNTPQVETTKIICKNLKYLGTEIKTRADRGRPYRAKGWTLDLCAIECNKEQSCEAFTIDTNRPTICHLKTQMKGSEYKTGWIGDTKNDPKCQGQNLPTSTQPTHQPTSQSKIDAELYLKVKKLYNKFVSIINVDINEDILNNTDNAPKELIDILSNEDEYVMCTFDLVYHFPYIKQNFDNGRSTYYKHPQTGKEFEKYIVKMKINLFWLLEHFLVQKKVSWSEWSQLNTKEPYNGAHFLDIKLRYKILKFIINKDIKNLMKLTFGLGEYFAKKYGSAIGQFSSFLVKHVDVIKLPNQVPHQKYFDGYMVDGTKNRIMYVNIIFLYKRPKAWRTFLLHELGHMTFFIPNYDYRIAMYKDTKMLNLYSKGMYWEDQAETFVLWYFLKFKYLERLNKLNKQDPNSKKTNDDINLFNKINIEKKYISNRLGWFDKFEHLGLKTDYPIKDNVTQSWPVPKIAVDETSLTDNGFFNLSV